ncbi:hypothetical protein HNO88_004206 [Novosphingobium chloroacetimidivorans]|uniref:Uncharacterized protein n=1 Tax=Novosphingobium chloroacetimidivorans TaxID=1428314 RepID=A0A7W7KDJ5_9SPHN|nr:hypothetical protein [Novosphingobium chloroacetimidivorans]
MSFDPSYNWQPNRETFAQLKAEGALRHEAVSRDITQVYLKLAKAAVLSENGSVHLTSSRPPELCECVFLRYFHGYSDPYLRSNK